MENNSKKEFDDSINFTRLAFMLSGVKLEHSKYFGVLFFVNLSWLYTDVTGEICWLIQGVKMNKSLDELSMVAPCLTMCVMATAKIIPFFYDKETLLAAIHKLRAFHPDFNNIDDGENFTNVAVEMKIFTQWKKFLKSVVVFLTFAFAAVVCMFALEPFVVMLYEYYTIGVMDLKMPFVVAYFFDPYANYQIRIFVYLHQFWSSILVCTYIFACDTLFYTFCSFLTMHFEILGHRLTNVVCTSGEITKENIRKCIIRHQELIEFVDFLQTLYSKSTLVNLITSSIMLCLSGFNVMVVKKASTAFAFLPFLVTSLSQAFLMSYFGDLLMVSSSQISDAAYNSSWYNAEPHIKSRIMMIICRSHKPCKLTAAGFADLNLKAFATILSRSWTYFAVLKTMYD